MTTTVPSTQDWAELICLSANGLNCLRTLTSFFVCFATCHYVSTDLILTQLLHLQASQGA